MKILDNINIYIF